MVFYNVSEEVLMERCLARAKTSGRADDNPETLVKRLRAFNEQSKPVVELYKKYVSHVAPFSLPVHTS